jgi:glycosyltransferase involved in cell wall biosynthesis
MNSGFSIVAKNLAIGLKKLGHIVTFTGMQTAYMPEYGYCIEQLPIQVGHIDDMTQYMITLDRIKPDLVLNIFQADYEYNDFPKVFKKNLWYVPCEGRNISQVMANGLLSVQMNGGNIVAQTEYGKEEIQLALAGLNVPFIYHGFDNKIFKPVDLSKRDEITYCYYSTESGKANSDPIILHKSGCYDCQLNNKGQTMCPYYKEEQVSILRFINGKWGEESLPIIRLPEVTRGKFVFGFVGQNLGVRKRIERLIKSYSMFIKDSKQLRDRTVLHLHTKPISIGGINLINVIQDLDIQSNIIFSYGTYRSSGWTDTAMNILYNTFDTNVSASSGEGFGLGTLESMACGKPNIGPDCSSFTELIGKDEKTGRGLLASIGEYQMIQDGSQRALVNESDLALKMRYMHTDEKLRERFSKNAIKFASNYTWEKICLQWNDLIKKITE